MATANQEQGTTTLQLVLAWGFVGIPLVWACCRRWSTR